MRTPDFDLIIIGSGSGNSLIGPEYANSRVAIVESGTFGGTCLNVGCIPTKMFVYAAEVADTVRGSARYGVDAHIDNVRWTDIRDRIFGRIDPISAGGKDYRADGSNTTLFTGRARFVGPKTLSVTAADGSAQEITGSRIVIATGARPMLPPVIADSDVDVHTSDTVMRLATLPSSMLIVGGGYIASEFAHVFSALGVTVTVINRGQGLLRHLDDEISAAFTAAAVEQWDVRLGLTVEALTPRDGGRAHVTFSDGSTLDPEVVLVATGRVPNSDDMGLAEAGVEVEDDGRVRVDVYGRTSAPDVWALGDVCSRYQLKHVANHEARVVEHNLTHGDDLRPFRHDNVPAAVFTHPQIATVGMTEREARAAGYDVTAKVQSYSDTAYGWAMEDTQSLLKVVADRASGRVLGAHFMGPQSSSLIQSLIQGMTFGQTAHEMARGQYWIHPALAEVVENALLGLDLEQPLSLL
ncbi:MAG: mycothione reductase [Ornithinimicrobium sp.]